MTLSGGTFQLGDRTITRMGYGAMQLAGPHVFGPPRDRDACVAVLREVVATGITHIDTSDFYGPYVTNSIIKEALHPYADDLTIVTKVGARRTDKGEWRPWLDAEGLTQAVHDNLDHLGLDVLDAVNLRLMDGFTAPLETVLGPLVALQEKGLIRHIGLSNGSLAQLEEARTIVPIVTVQNLYNVAQRGDEPLVDHCAEHGIAFAPFFPLGGFTPLQSATLDGVASRLGTSAQQVALAWLLQHSPAIVLIPGTSSAEHLRENIAAADLVLDVATVKELDAIGG